MSTTYTNDLSFLVFLLVEITRAKKKQDISISKKLGEHQTLESWKYREAALIIHDWFNSMNSFFFNNELPIPSISFDQTRIDTLSVQRIFTSIFCT